jgi:hypothetical protein
VNLRRTAGASGSNLRIELGAATGWALAGFAAFIALAWVGIEAGIWLRGMDAREPLLVAVAGAFISCLCGVPFAAKLARMGAKNDDGEFWKVWGLGVLTRSGVSGATAVLLMLRYPSAVNNAGHAVSGHADAGIVVLALLHFAALLMESVWVAGQLAGAKKPDAGK